MPVHVTEEDHLILAVVGSHQLLGEEDGWVQHSGRVGPAAIQVATDHVAAVVTGGHAVRIQHGHYLEDKGVPQQLCLPIVRLQQELDGAVHHE